MHTGVSSYGVVWQVFFERYTRVLMEASPEFPIHFLKIYRTRCVPKDVGSCWIPGSWMCGCFRAVAPLLWPRGIVRRWASFSLKRRWGGPLEHEITNCETPARKFMRG